MCPILSERKGGGSAKDGVPDLNGRQAMCRIVAIVLICFALPSCDRSALLGTPGSGVAKTKTLEFGPIDQVELSGAATLEVVIGQPQSIVVTCDDNILPLIEIRETEGRLVVRPMEKIHDYDLVIKATVADFRRVKISGLEQFTLFCSDCRYESA